VTGEGLEPTSASGIKREPGVGATAEETQPLLSRPDVTIQAKSDVKFDERGGGGLPLSLALLLSLSACGAVPQQTGTSEGLSHIARLVRWLHLGEQDS
jgi:hypothetical protein